MENTVSVIICTHNHAESLRETLRAINQVRVPQGMTAELIIVDNGSNDHTRELVDSIRLPYINLRYVNELRRGLFLCAKYRYLETCGAIILFTDDDVRPPANWIEEMCAPILSGEADAVAGGVKLAPELLRPWMAVCHRGMARIHGRVESGPIRKCWLVRTAGFFKQSPGACSRF